MACGVDFVFVFVSFPVVQEALAELAVRALTLIKEADMQKTVEGFADVEVDNCLKYVYWGLSTGVNAAALLKWQAALVEKGGAGSIMRVLTEKRVAEIKVLA